MTKLLDGIKEQIKIMAEDIPWYNMTYAYKESKEYMVTPK